MLSYSAIRRVSASPAFKRALSTSRPTLFAAQASIPRTKLFINGEFIDSKTDKWIELRNPVRAIATPRWIRRAFLHNPRYLTY